MSHCFRCHISGRVQGVWFRATAQRQAERLGLRGSARNRPDGTVEVVACGEEAALQLFREWLQQGPRDARVDAVQCEPLQLAQELAGFVIG